MRITVWVIGILAAVWCGYWVAASSAITRGAEGWFEERRSEGWAADYATLGTAGFPYRFETTLEGVTLADPETGVLWELPVLTAHALAYRPGHIIAVFPPEQTLASPFNELTITTEDMRASARLSGTNVALGEGTAEIAALTARSTQGWEVTMESALAAARATDAETADEHGYDLYFEARNLRPSDRLRLGIDPQSRLPDVFERVTLDATTRFDAPWDRFAIERARPQPRMIEIRNFDAVWGQLELRAAGRLDIDESGIPEGTVTIKATNWREIVSLGEATGAIPPGLVRTITRALEVLASLSGPPNTIDVPLSFRSGRLSLGPIPLGRAPVIRLR